MSDWGRLTVVVGMISLSAIGLAAVLLLGPGQTTSEQLRLGALFGFLGIGMTSMAAAFRANRAADATAKALNGDLDKRVERIVERVVEAHMQMYRGDLPERRHAHQHGKAYSGPERRSTMSADRSRDDEEDT